MTLQTFAGPAKFLGLVLLATLLVASFTSPSRARQEVPDPKLDVPKLAGKGLETAVFAGGCFWGVEAVFEHVKGVSAVASGYAGGSSNTANYRAVSSGQSGHAEAVKITYDPAQVSYGQLLKVFFSVAHDPTQLNRQGPDRGAQYRSAIFFANADQQRIASAYIAQMGDARIFGNKPIVTQVGPLKAFFPAEGYHQDFARLNPNHPYIVFHDAPKVANLKRQFPMLYRNSWSTELAARSKPKG